MALLSTKIEAIIKLGAQVSVSAADYPYTVLGTFLTSAVAVGTMLTIRDAAQLSASVLEALAREGGKSVRFEF